MREPASPEPTLAVSNRTVVIALYIFYLANFGRVLAVPTVNPGARSHLNWSIGLELVFILLYSLVLFFVGYRRAKVHPAFLHLYLLFQCGLVTAGIILWREYDFITNLFILLSFQAAVLCTGRVRWIWVGALFTLTALLQAFTWGLLRGLGLGLVTMVAEIVIAVYVVTDYEVKTAQARSQAMLLELQETHRQLRLYASQVEELAGVEERNRLARELHDSVSQTMFSIQLNARAAQMMLEKNPARVRAQLEQLQSLVQSALAEMRSLITQLRLKNE